MCTLEEFEKNTLISVSKLNDFSIVEIVPGSLREGYHKSTEILKSPVSKN